MNRANRLEQILKSFGGSATLSEIKTVALSRGFHDVHHHLTAATSELRAELRLRTPAETLVWKRGKTPGQGVYTIFPARVRNGEVLVLARQLTFGPAAAI